MTTAVESPPAVKTLAIQGDQNRLRIEAINAPGPLEAQVLCFQGEMGDSTVHQIYKFMRKQAEAAGEKEKEYTTILNTLANLVAKGLVTRQQADGTNRTLHVYSPAVTSQELNRRIIEKTLAHFEEVAKPVLDEVLARR